jgi:predicted secreted protein
MAGMQVTELLLQSYHPKNNALGDDGWDSFVYTPSERALSLSGAGVFYSSRAEEQFAAYAYSGDVVRMKLALHDVLSAEGEFIIERYSFKSISREPLTFSLSLKSSAAVSFL